VHGVISLQIAKGSDGWVQWRPIEQRMELVLDATLRGLVRDPSRLDNIARGHQHKPLTSGETE